MKMHPFNALILLLGLALLSLAQPLAAQDASFKSNLKNWEKTIDNIDRNVNADNLNQDEIDNYRDDLRAIKNQASEQIKQSQSILATKQGLLSALGNVPAEGDIEENAYVRQERKSLNDEIRDIDSRMKQSNLIQSRVQNLQDSLNRNQSFEKRQELFSRDLTLYSFNFIPTIYQELSDLKSSSIWWTPILTGASVLFFMTLAYIFRPSLLRALVENIPLGHRLPASATIIYIALFSAIILAILRFKVISQPLPDTLFLVRFVASLFLAISTFYLLKRAKQSESQLDESTPIMLKRMRIWSGFITLLQIAAVSAIPSALFGYVNFAQFFAFASFMTLASISLFFILRLAAEWVHKRLKGTHTQANPDNLSPLSVSVVEPIFAIGCLALATHFWGYGIYRVGRWAEQYEDGIPIGNITLNVTDLITGIIVFVVFIALTRLIQWFMGSRVFVHTALNSGVKDAIIALTGYAGITIGIFAGLTTTGLDMSNLAIIAGALSVGIGFGLQAIFSNFVSGLILFFERPIKVGDWVIVGQNQGFVKKIRVRSTEIETFQNASIMIPNSQFISEAVTNWTLNDAVGRIEVIVGVAYGSDVDKVRDLMVKIASQNKDLRKRPEPLVLFKDFGDSALIFELRCFLKDIKLTAIVASDLRYGIEKAFREHQISIPFPQRDLHIVQSVPFEVKKPRS